jgi:hypothetical protein
VSEVIELAAKEWGLSVTTLRRLLRGEAKSLSWIFAEQFRKRLRQTEWDRLERVLFSPKARRIRDHYADFIEAEIEKLGTGRGPENATWHSDSELRELAEFDRQARLLGAPGSRATLSRLRVYDPLLAWPPLGRRFRSLSGMDRRNLVRSRLRAELTLLRAEMKVLRDAARSS